MQNKSAVLIFTVLLALATLYTLSFNYFSSEFEKEAAAQKEEEIEAKLAMVEQLQHQVQALQQENETGKAASNLMSQMINSGISD